MDKGGRARGKAEPENSYFEPERWAKVSGRGSPYFQNIEFLKIIIVGENLEL
jgi:hypothetical protein